MKLIVQILLSLLLIQVGIVLSWDTPRITEPGEFPYIVGIMWKPNEIAIHFTSCAAAILNEFWYLTAAHCISFEPNVGNSFIKAGTHNITAVDEHVQLIKIVHRIIYMKYLGRSLQFTNLANYDIGLLKGETALTFNDFVKPIKLPKPKTIISDQKLEYNLVASGWGLFPHAYVEENLSGMRSIHLPLVHNKVCQTALRHLFNDITLSDTQICTRPLDGSTGACIANHGGPLVQYNKRNEPIVVGVVSWSSLACNTNNLPPVYIRVSYFVKWIKSKIKS